MSQSELIYEGKAKKIYSLPQEPENVLIDFKDSLTAFNALKKGSFEDKGSLNRDIASLIFRYLHEHKISSHYVRDHGLTAMVTKKVKIIPLEVVVRNVLAGSTAKKLGIAEGKVLEQPLVEFYYKDDALQDPFVSDDQVLMMGVASKDELAQLKKIALQVNDQLKNLFRNARLILVDFKIELGRDSSGQILLADEITPDCCRLWDVQTNEKMDKDRFRRDLGKVKESYQEVLVRLKSVYQGGV